MDDVMLHFSRLAKLTDSIRRNGYSRNDEHDGDVIAKLMVHPGKGVRYVLVSGKHRAAVLAALGFERIPIRLTFSTGPAINHVECWPHVRNGLFTCEQALELFHRLWEGRPPPGAVPPEWHG
jgi:hypothetical protein